MIEKPFTKIQNPALRAYFRHQWYMIHNVKKNMLSLTTGGSGDGKSWATIVHNYYLDPTFNVDKIVYNERQFYNALDNITRVGEFILWDEAGVGIPAKEWYAISNKAIGKTLQVFRANKRVGLTFTTQDMSFIDSQSRKLLNYFFMMENRKQEHYSTMWVREIMVNRFIGKLYMPYPRILVNGKKYRFKNIKWDRDAIMKDKDLAELLHQYDKKSKPIKQKLTKDFQESVEKWRDKEQEKAISKLDKFTILKDKIKNDLNTYCDHTGYISINLISMHENVSDKVARTVKTIIEKELLSVKNNQEHA